MTPVWHHHHLHVCCGSYQDVSRSEEFAQLKAKGSEVALRIKDTEQVRSFGRSFARSLVRSFAHPSVRACLHPRVVGVVDVVLLLLR